MSRFKSFTIICLCVLIIVAAGVVFCALNGKVLRLQNEPNVVYCYQYLDENDEIKGDSVELSKADSSVIYKLLNNKIFISAADELKGFTTKYSITFTYNSGENNMVLIRYGRNGLLRLPGTIYDYQLRGKEKEEFFAILNKYHRYPRVLLAG